MYDHDSIQFTADGRFCVTGSTQRSATLWDLKTGDAVRQFGGHEKPIYAMRLLENDRTLETRSSDVAQHWNVESGKLLVAFRAPSETDSSPWRKRTSDVGALVTPSPDGETFLCDDSVFETVTGRRVRTFSFPISRYERLHHYYRIDWKAYTPDGKKVILFYNPAISHHQTMAVLFDVASGEVIRHLSRSPVPRYQLQWSPDGRRATTACDDVLRLWDVENGRTLQAIGTVAPHTIHGNPRISFSANSRFIYSHQGGAFFWDAETGEPLHQAPRNQGPANKRSLADGLRQRSFYGGRSALSPDQRLLASCFPASKDRSHKLFLWDVENGRILRTLDHPEVTPLNSYFSPDGRYLAVACLPVDECVVMWEVESGKRVYSLPVQKIVRYHVHTTVKFLPDGRRMIVNSGQKELTLHDVETGKLISSMISKHPDPPKQRPTHLQMNMLLSPDARYVIAGYGNEYAIVWELRTGKQILLDEQDMGGSSVSRRCQFSDDSRQLFAFFNQRRLWDLESGRVKELSDAEVRAGIPGFTKPPPVVRIDPIAGHDVPQETLDRFVGHIPDNAIGVKQTGDGRRLIVYHANGRMAFWEIATETRLFDCYQFHNGSRWLTVMPDGQCRGNLEYVRFRKPGTIERVSSRRDE